MNVKLKNLFFKYYFFYGNKSKYSYLKLDLFTQRDAFLMRKWQAKIAFLQKKLWSLNVVDTITIKFCRLNEKKFFNLFPEICMSDKSVLQSRQNATVQQSIENKSRRRRTAFTSSQLLELEREFQAKKYLSLTERSEIANSLKLSEVQVNIIFAT